MKKLSFIKVLFMLYLNTIFSVIGYHSNEFSQLIEEVNSQNALALYAESQNKRLDHISNIAVMLGLIQRLINELQNTQLTNPQLTAFKQSIDAGRNGIKHLNNVLTDELANSILNRKLLVLGYCIGTYQGMCAFRAGILDAILYGGAIAAVAGIITANAVTAGITGLIAFGVIFGLVHLVSKRHEDIISRQYSGKDITVEQRNAFQNAVFLEYTNHFVPNYPEMFRDPMRDPPEFEN